MLASPQTQLIEITKGVYFSKGRNLFYIKDIMPDGDFVLIENCKTNRAMWWSYDKFVRAKKEVIL